jgi:Raf kinase inhibitor-like YbhB/YbcL family protein
MTRRLARVAIRPVMIIPLVAIMLCAAGCSKGRPSPTSAATITVTSSAFGNGRPIPAKYTCDGAGISPPLAWRGVPDRARELALVVDDPDAPGGTYTHWVVLDIPVDSTSVAEGAVPENAVLIDNSSGHPDYAPPCPPSGTHHYRFTVYALSAAADLGDHSLDSALRAIKHLSIGWGRLVGTYHRG